MHPLCVIFPRSSQTNVILVVVPVSSWITSVASCLYTCPKIPRYFAFCLQCFDAVGWVAGRASSL